MLLRKGEQFLLHWNLVHGKVYITLCDKVDFTTGRWFSLGTLVSSTSKTDRHDITEILLKVAVNTINQPTLYIYIYIYTVLLFIVLLL